MTRKLLVLLAAVLCAREVRAQDRFLTITLPASQPQLMQWTMDAMMQNQALVLEASTAGVVKAFWEGPALTYFIRGIVTQGDGACSTVRLWAAFRLVGDGMSPDEGYSAIKSGAGGNQKKGWEELEAIAATVKAHQQPTSQPCP